MAYDHSVGAHVGSPFKISRLLQYINHSTTTTTTTTNAPVYARHVPYRCILLTYLLMVVGSNPTEGKFVFHILLY